MKAHVLASMVISIAGICGCTQHKPEATNEISNNTTLDSRLNQKSASANSKQVSGRHLDEPVTKTAVSKTHTIVPEIEPKNVSADLEQEIRHLISTINEARRSRYGSQNPSVDKLAEIGQPAVPYLIEALSNDTTAANAITALGKIGPDAKESIPVLIQFLKKHKYQWKVADAMSGFGPAANDAVPYLIKLLKQSMGGRDSTDQVTAQALGKIGNAKAFDILVKALSSKDDVLGLLAQDAAEALGNLGDKRAIPHLIHATESEYDMVRSASIEALTHHFVDKNVIPTFVTSLDDESDLVRGLAYAGLAILSHYVQPEEFVELVNRATKGSSQIAKQNIDELFVTQGLITPESQALPVINPKWTKFFEYSEFSFVDFASNHMYLAGRNLLKMNNSGDQQWAVPIPTSIHESRGNMVVDPAGNTYVTTTLKDTDICTLKYDPNGQIVWENRTDSVKPKYGSPYPKCISKLINGKVVVAGVFRGGDNGDDRIFLIKYNEFGETIDVIQGVGDETQGLFGIKNYRPSSSGIVSVDQLGNVYTLLSQYPKDPQNALVKFDSLGNLQWTVAITGFDRVASNATTLICGESIYLYGKNDDSRARIMNFRSDGEIVFDIKVQGTQVAALAVDKQRYTYVLSEFWPKLGTRKSMTSPPQTAILTILDTKGNTIAKKRIVYTAEIKGLGGIQFANINASGELGVISQWWEGRRGSSIQVMLINCD